MKPKITWITGDYFVDCEFNYDFFKKIFDYYDITWIILFGKYNRYCPKDFDIFKSFLNINFLYLNYSGKSLRNFYGYFSIYKVINKIDPDLIYLNIGTDTPFILPMFYKIRSKKLIVTAHQGEVHSGMSHHTLSQWVRDRVYKDVSYVHMFTNSQASLFKNRYKKPFVFLSHLGLKEFGEPTIIRDDKSNIVKFLAFGIINYAKHIDLLIDAANKLIDNGITNFKVVIKGGCENWEYYNQKIKYPEFFETDIRLIDNSEIPNLFADSHFFVQPYRVLSQSGPTKIAFRYNIPVIASDLPGFKEEIINGVNGYLFKSNSVDALYHTMFKVIDKFSSSYFDLSNRMREYTFANYSSTALAEQYIAIFNQVIKE